MMCLMKMTTKEICRSTNIVLMAETVPIPRRDGTCARLRDAVGSQTRIYLQDLDYVYVAESTQG